METNQLDFTQFTLNQDQFPFNGNKSIHSSQKQEAYNLIYQYHFCQRIPFTQVAAYIQSKLNTNQPDTSEIIPYRTLSQWKQNIATLIKRQQNQAAETQARSLYSDLEYLYQQALKSDNLKLALAVADRKLRCITQANKRNVIALQDKIQEMDAKSKSDIEEGEKAAKLKAENDRTFLKTMRRLTRALTPQNQPEPIQSPTPIPAHIPSPAHAKNFAKTSPKQSKFTKIVPLNTPKSAFILKPNFYNKYLNIAIPPIQNASLSYKMNTIT